MGSATRSVWSACSSGLRIRRLVLVEGRSQREVALRLWLARDTVAKAVRSETPPKYSSTPAGSKLDPFKEWICESLRDDATIQSQRLLEMASELGYVGGKTVFDDFVREVPRVAPGPGAAPGYCLLDRRNQPEMPKAAVWSCRGRRRARCRGCALLPH